MIKAQPEITDQHNDSDDDDVDDVDNDDVDDVNDDEVSVSRWLKRASDAKCCSYAVGLGGSDGSLMSCLTMLLSRRMTSYNSTLCSLSNSDNRFRRLSSLSLSLSLLINTYPPANFLSSIARSSSSSFGSSSSYWEMSKPVRI